jgi:hypothetical protein
MAGDPALRRIATSEETRRSEARTPGGPKPRVHLDRPSTRTRGTDLLLQRRLSTLKGLHSEEVVGAEEDLNR